MEPDFATRYAALGRADLDEVAASLAEQSLDESLQHFFDEVLAMHEFLLSFRLQDGSTPPWPTPTSDPISIAVLAREAR